jgi:hypothetical protein
MIIQIIEFIPLLTTLFAVFFFKEITAHYLDRKKTYLLWWTIGVLTFGLGTLAESFHAIFGFNELNLRYWYIVGALLGGFPLAQGSVYLLVNRTFAHFSTGILLTIILVASWFVINSPITLPVNFDGRLTGSVFQWSWLRGFSPIINIYSFIFLVGGAAYSAVKYYKQGIKEAPFKGNIYIALGGLLPGIGGTFTRFGYVEVLYVTEFIGLLLIYFGYSVIKKNRKYPTYSEN